MNFFELILTAIGLSMDAFAVSVTNGLCCKDLQKKHVLSIGLCFGIMQGLMPTIGFLLGQAFTDYITAVDHYIALILLGYIGGKMILDAVKEFKESGESGESGSAEPESYHLSGKTIFMQGVATSIDALAVGVSFSALANISIVPAALEIAVITCVLSIIGVCFGKRLGQKFGSYALLAGGLILVLLGVKIFIQHMFFS